MDRRMLDTLKNFDAVWQRVQGENGKKSSPGKKPQKPAPNRGKCCGRRG